MKALYFDCFSGAAGDMIVGSLVDLGVPAKEVRQALDSLKIPGMRVTFGSVRRGGLGARKFTVRARGKQPHRSLSDIRKLLGRGRVTAGARKIAGDIFERLCRAEARVHRVPVERVHLHEVGAVDSIADVLGAAVCLDLLRPDRIVVSPLATGSGTVECEHGTLPVPPPATVELLRGALAYPGPSAGEMLTPTGAAILTTVADEYGAMPRMRLRRTGLGAGDRTGTALPNVLRVLEGDLDDDAGGTGEILILEANVDDMSPQVCGHLMERLFEEGALEVFYTPVQMKKNRPGLLISALCRPQRRERLVSLILRESTSIGVRWRAAHRQELARQTVRVKTPHGTVSMKVSSLNGEVLQASPEYDECRKLARRLQVPLRDVQEEAVRAWRRGRKK